MNAAVQRLIEKHLRSLPKADSFAKSASKASHLATTITTLDYRSETPTTKEEFEEEARRLRRAYSKSTQKNVKIAVSVSPVYKRAVLKIYAPSKRDVAEVQQLLDTFGG
jgi:endo-alpha-1,4-polygalactosaminidase (GH114 family)